MPIAEVNGQRIAYDDTAPGSADKPAVVLAHGFLMSRRMFDAQVEALKDDFRVVCWDERGFGETPATGPFSYWDSADDMKALMDHLGIDRAVVGGMSQGGFLSMRFALRYPEATRGLILIDTAADNDDEATLAGYRQMLDTWVNTGPVDVIVQTVAGLILGAPEHWEPWVTQWKERPHADMKHPGDCLLDRDDISDRVGEIRAPTLVVHGTEDLAIKIDRGQMLVDAIPNARPLVKVDGAAHAANLTHPDQVNPPLVEFLKSL